MDTTEPSYLHNNLEAGLLNGKCADIADELANDCIPERGREGNQQANETDISGGDLFRRGKNDPQKFRPDPEQELTRCA
jgi:hypothetical protein